MRDFSDYEIDVETFVQQVVLPDCPPPYFALAHSMGGAVMLRVAHAGKRWFDRMVLSAPMIDLPGHRTAFPVARACCALLRLGGQGGRYIPGGSGALTGVGLVYQQSLHQRSRALRPQCRDPRGRSDARHRRRRRWRGPTPRSGRCTASAPSNYPSQIRQPILMLAASNDTVVSTPAIEEFAYHLRAGSHLVIAGAKHEILQEQDRYRAQFWAAFDAFVPGTPLFK